MSKVFEKYISMKEMVYLSYLRKKNGEECVQKYYRLKRLYNVV